MPLLQHSLDGHTITSMTFHHTPITMTQATSCMGGATPPPHSQRLFTASPLARMCLAFYLGPQMTEVDWEDPARPKEWAWQRSKSHSCYINRASWQSRKPRTINVHRDYTWATTHSVNWLFPTGY